MLNERIAENNNLPSPFGALVVNGSVAGELAVIPGSPAEKVGITENTIILSIDDTELSSVDLAAVLRTKSVGEVISLRILQNGEERTVQLELERAQ
jgi:S1-C subfamily serine protease